LIDFDTLIVVNTTEEAAMFKFKRSEPHVEFCDSCSCVCDQGCRAASVREQAVLNAFRFGARI
jgi:hypothetical protein